MRRMLARAAAAAAVSIAGAALACDRSPTRPGLPSVGSAVPRVEITGPATVPPGGTAQFRAVAFSDGVSRDATNSATWSTSDRRLVTIESGGLATGVAVGDAVITAVVDGRPAVKPIIVLPAGTYRVLGSVKESGVTLAIAGANVEARAGDRTVAETVTDASGNFRLYGVPSGAELVVSRDGYLTHSQTVTLTDHGSVNVTLALAAPRPDVSGAYTLTVGPAACTNTQHLLDPDLRRRTYRAVVTQNGWQLRVALSGAEFRLIRGTAANAFAGSFEPASAKFQLAPPGYYYLYSSSSPKPDVVEQLSELGGLLIAGNAITSRTASGMIGTLDGVIESYRGPIATTAPTGRCVSPAIPFALTR